MHASAHRRPRLQRRPFEDEDGPLLLLLLPHHLVLGRRRLQPAHRHPPLALTYVTQMARDPAQRGGLNKGRLG